MLRQLVPIALCLLGLGLPVQAECLGQNLIATLPEAERTALYAQSHAVPFAQGNLWRATKAGQVITLVGTYHMDDPRHDATMQQLDPVLQAATAVLVEAGPEEMAALKARFAAEPALMVVTDGPTLPEDLPTEVWQRLSASVC